MIVKKKRHAEVPVKVNAWVDKGVAPLVEALNCYDDVWTTSSCEGNDGSSHVVFAFNGQPGQFCHIAQRLADSLAKDFPDNDLWRLQVAWAYGSAQPLATLHVNKRSVKKISKSLRRNAPPQIRVLSRPRSAPGIRSRRRGS